MPTASGRPSMMDAILAGEEVRMHIGNKEACYQKPVKSMLTGEHFTQRHQYEDHLKRNNCHIAEPDSKAQSKDLRGDFNVRKELKEAVNHILNK